MRRSRRAGVVVTLTTMAALTAPLAACSSPDGAGPVRPAPHAQDAVCDTALAAAPQQVLAQPRSPLAVKGTAAWGEPAIVLRCGLDEPGATTQRCLTIDGRDWIVDDSADPIIFTSFGRYPAAQVLVPVSYGRENATGALVDLAASAAALPTTEHHCQ